MCDGKMVCGNKILFLYKDHINHSSNSVKILHLQYITYFNFEQECIPVGCVPPASVGVSEGGCLPKGVCLPRGVHPWPLHAGIHPPPVTCDACCEQNHRQA